MARAHVVGVAGLEELLLVSGAERDLAPDDIARVLALALVVRQPLEEGGQVGVLPGGMPPIPTWRCGWSRGRGRTVAA